MTAFPPGRRAALERLRAINPARYSRSRNFLSGAVTRLSPYIRHGILELAEVRDAVIARGLPTKDVEKLIQELAWRDYYRRVYGTIGTRIWDDIEPYKTGLPASAYARELPDDIRAGTTGAACIDGFVRDLVDEGYVHNHARMYFASYVVHHRRVRWQAGAAFYLEHLLDGDPASNNLSWQWVASTFAHEPYIFNRENLERYTENAYCGRCPLARGGCPFDGDYAALDRKLFPPDRTPTESGARISLNAPPDPLPPDLPRTRNVVIWAHTDALSDVNVARRAFPDAPVIFAWDQATRSAERWSDKRIAFIEGALAEMRIDARAEGDAAAAIVAFARNHQADAVMTIASVDPGLDRIAAVISKSVPLYALHTASFVTLERPVDLRRFSRFWRIASDKVFGNV